MASDSWHSFDSSPWRYPWINKPNLQNMWQFSRMLLDNLEHHREKVSYKDLRFALVGNMANFAKLTRDALGDFGNRCWIIPHPHDLYHLSQPEWEEYEGQLSQEFLGDYNLGANLTQSIQIPVV